MSPISAFFPLLDTAANPQQVMTEGLSAADAATKPVGGGFLGGLGSWGSIIIIGVVFLVFYLLVMRPQSKKQKETEKMLAAMKKGDKVVTIGGVHGTVASVKDKTVVIKVDEACKIEFLRSAIASVEVRGEASAEAADDSQAKQ